MALFGGKEFVSLPLTKLGDYGTPVAISTAGAVTFTAAQVLTGMIIRNCNGANRADLFPTAADFVNALGNGVKPGHHVDFWIRNNSGAAETTTLTTNTGLTLSGTMAVAQNNAKHFRAVVTTETKGSEAVTVYSLNAASAF